jgi:hypothetical protein
MLSDTVVMTTQVAKKSEPKLALPAELVEAARDYARAAHAKRT